MHMSNAVCNIICKRVIVWFLGVRGALCNSKKCVQVPKFVTGPTKVGQLSAHRIGLVFELKLAITFKVHVTVSYAIETLMLAIVNIDKSPRKQRKFMEDVMINTDHQKHCFLNMWILCRYAQFSQALPHFLDNLLISPWISWTTINLLLHYSLFAFTWALIFLE